MIQFKHYSKYSLIPSGDFAFRQYSAARKNERIIQYIDGTLTELLPEDFGTTTTLNNYAIAYMDNLERIEMSDSVQTVYLLSIWNVSNLKEVVFSANIASIDLMILNTTIVLTKQTFNNEITLDFSKAKQVPTFFSSNASYKLEDTSCPFSESHITTIKVPSSLYSQWISSKHWKNAGVVDKIVAA